MARIYNPLIVDVALLLNRIALGALFLFAGYRKLFPAGKGIGEALSGFVNSQLDNAPLPEFLAKVYLFTLPFMEVLAGLLLIVGLLTRVWAAIIALMLLSFMLAFGIGWWPDSGPAFDPNVILFTLALLLATLGSGRLGLDPVVCSRKPKSPAIPG